MTVTHELTSKEKVAIIYVINKHSQLLKSLLKNKIISHDPYIEKYQLTRNQARLHAYAMRDGETNDSIVKVASYHL
jgi:hypothetical protein